MARRFMGIGLALVLVSLGSGSGATPRVDRSDEPAARPETLPGLSWRLSRLVEAASHPAHLQELMAKWRIERRGSLVRVEVVPAEGVALAEITDSLVKTYGGEVIVRGVTMLDAWMPLARMRQLAHQPQLKGIRLPTRPVTTTGEVVSDGVSASGADDFQCVGIGGAGVVVGVMDSQFAGLEAAAQAGEIPNLDGTAGPGLGGGHGTGCAEIVSDMAPSAAIRPILTTTASEMQYFVQNLPFKPVDVVSQSLMFMGTSYGGGDGPICDMVAAGVDNGVAWVASAGNIEAGTFWSGELTDTDGDGWMEFAEGDEHLDFTGATTAGFSVNLDWDDYANPTQDMDLYIFRWEGGDWEQVGASIRTQGLLDPPYEDVTVPSSSLTQYAIGVFAHDGVEAGIPLRILIMGSSAPKLEYAGGPGAAYDPGACLGSVSVGGLRPSSYDTGPPPAYSPSGPTTDGRISPDLVAPSQAQTSSSGNFEGTSAAAPHVAGAVAVYQELLGTTPQQALAALLEDAIPMGDTSPNNTYGVGRLNLDRLRTDWQCHEGEIGECDTGCGTSGETTCGSNCQWLECLAPDEACSGADDDCDGRTDEGFGCSPGMVEACQTECETDGTRVCVSGCEWGACEPPEEVCGGGDEDCDGLIDEAPGCAVSEDSGGCAMGGGADWTGSPLVFLIFMVALHHRRSRSCASP
ncbi:MAG: S8 family serine peptidase [Myxococcota bacterium]|nr:S8 family serine peptidase [Myxococcota bacterium]